MFMRRIITLLVVVAAGWAQAPGAAAMKSHVDSRIDSVIGTIKVVNLEGGKPGMIYLKKSAGADSAPDSIAIVRDSVYHAISAFYYDQFRHTQDPEAPTFLFMSKSAGMLMGIGGVVRMRGWYDWGGAIPGNGFMPYLIPIPENPASTRKLGTTPAGTALYFQMLGRCRFGNYRLYIEANFNGYQGRDFCLKKAYASFRDFTVGYANSTFSDPAALAPTVDAQGAANKLAKTDVLVRYMPTFRNRYTVALSLENPSSRIAAAAGETESTSDWMPDIAAFAQYQWAQGQHVRLAGVLRTLGYRDLLAGKNHNVAGWAFQLSSVAHPLTAVTTYATASYGRGYGSLLNDMLAGSYDLVADPSRPGRMYAPASYGYCLGLQYNFTPSLFASCSFSQARYLPRKGDPDEYKYGWVADINLFWDILPRLQVGAEFDLGKRMNMDGAHRYARRVGAMCQFSF